MNAIDQEANGAADRRGRRASWIAAGLFALLAVVAFTQLDDWYRRERYLRLREHEMRRNRFEIERLLASAEPRPDCGAILVTIDELSEADWTAMAGDTLVTPTLTWLRENGKLISIPDGGAGPDRAARLALELARTLRESGYRTVAILGAASDSDGVSREIATVFDAVIDDRPRITSFVDEGEAGWVSLRAVRELTTPGDRRLFLWLRYADLASPHLPCRQFPHRDARTSELAAVDHYLSRVWEGLHLGTQPGHVLIVSDGFRARLRGIDAGWDQVGSAILDACRQRVSD